MFSIVDVSFLISKRSHSVKLGFLYFFSEIFFINLFDSSISISTKKTFDPCSQKCSTIDPPIPDPPPVMKTFLFSKS